MLPNMHPADELSLVRSELRRLRERELELRDGFIKGLLPREGGIARVQLKVQRRRMLKRDKLPTNIQNNPDYWQMRENHVVQIEDRSAVWHDDDGLEDLVVIEPFNS